MFSGICSRLGTEIIDPEYVFLSSDNQSIFKLEEPNELVIISNDFDFSRTATTSPGLTL